MKHHKSGLFLQNQFFTSKNFSDIYVQLFHTAFIHKVAFLTGVW